MRLTWAFALVIAIQPVDGLAQQAESVQQSNPAYNLWLIRSQSTTEDLIKDAATLNPWHRALLWARLAELWWRDNPEKASSWMAKAIEIVEDVPNKENSIERRERLSTARLILQIVTPLDQKLSKRLVSILSDDVAQVADAERTANADGLIEAAISLVKKDPQRAAELGALALRVGRPRYLMSLLWALRGKNAKLADALFVQALSVTRQTLSPEVLNSLTHAAFPAEMQQLNAKVTVPPDDLRLELLQLHVAFLQANPTNAENRNSICGSVVGFISPVVRAFDRLLPQQAPIVRHAINQCQALSPLAQQRIDDGLRNQPLNTVDDLVKAADDASDLKVRTVYLYRAASLAKEKKDYDRALNILDSMSKEAREFMADSWVAYRWEWSALSALDHFKRGEVYEMREVMRTVPADLQPLAKIAFVQRLPANRDNETDPTQEFLDDARRDLGRSGLLEPEKTGAYFALLELTVKYQPANATSVLKDAVASLNRSTQVKDGSEDNALLKSISPRLPAVLLEMDESAVKEAVATISKTETRARLRLDLLGACLAKLSTLKQTTPHSQPATP